MYTPHTVTVYNTFIDVDPNSFEETEIISSTILEGVFLDESKGANVRATGLDSADAATLYIPFDIRAKDAQTGKLKKYVSPKQFITADDKTNLWTLDIGGNTLFVAGRIVEDINSLSMLEDLHDRVYNITKVDLKNYGSKSMQHWEVGGA